jgi:hypothetical protein
MVHTRHRISALAAMSHAIQKSSATSLAAASPARLPVVAKNVLKLRIHRTGVVKKMAQLHATDRHPVLFPPVPVLLPAVPVAAELIARVVLQVRHQECAVVSVPPRPRAVLRGRQRGQITCREAAVADADNAPYLHSCQRMLTDSPALLP